jgi:hypothetical protein
VAAEDTSPRPAATATRLRLRWLVIVVAVMALLTAGWPLLNSAVTNRQPLAAGSRLTVGTNPANSAVLTVRGAGWAELSDQSNPMQKYLLQRGKLELTIRHVLLAGRDQVPRLWQGLRQIISVTNPGLRLSRPVYITTGHRLRAITGLMTGAGIAGTATIVPGPSRGFGIEMIALAPRGTGEAVRAAAVAIMTSLRFTASPS